jgi:hypothetical protein
MTELSILFLQVFLGITSPTSDQISKVTYDQQQKAASFYNTKTTTASTTDCGYMTGTPIDPNEIN